MSSQANSRPPKQKLSGQRAGDNSFPQWSRLMAVEGGFQSAMTQLTSDVLLSPRSRWRWAQVPSTSGCSQPCKGRELLQRGQFARVIHPLPEAPQPFGE